MKKFILLLSGLLLTGLNATAQTFSAGYTAVTHSKYRVASTSESDASDATKAAITIHYHDGLGRPVQTLGYRQSPLQRDLILKYTEYDKYGRMQRDYLPVPTTATDGSYKTTTHSLGVSFYGDNQPYSSHEGLSTSGSTGFDNSPLNRERDSYGPGLAWATNTKRVQTAEAAAEAALSRIYEFNGSGNIVRNGSYPAGTLSKKTFTDEQGNVTREISDRFGRVILKTQNDGTQDLGTYFIYHPRGNLLAVLQPEAYALDAGITKDSDVWQKYVFAYEYDERNRVIRKHIPGEGWTEIVYDLADRPVMTRNAHQLTLNRWTFFQYDAHNREIAKGEMAKTTTRAAAQSLFNSQTQINEKWVDWTGYTEVSFPTSLKPVQDEIERYYFYDTYFFIAAEFAFKPAGAFHTQKTDAKGLLTGIAKRNSRNDAVYYTDTYYYDALNRRIQTQHVHQKSVTNQSNVIVKNYQFNFAGEVLKEDVTYPFATGTIDVKTHHDYDHAGRVTKTYHGINTTPTEIIRYAYDETGRMTQKKYLPNGTYTASGTSISGLQTIDFAWHLRGGLLGINLNGSGNAIPTASQGDLFSYKLEYETASQWDGSIGKQHWNHVLSNSPVGQRSYTFTYDAAKRLKKASYTGLSSENYTLQHLKYDRNGNINGLNRSGKTGTSTFGAIDRLRYTYSGNRLTNVADTVTTGYEVDLIPNGSGNYTYYNNGSLKTDDNSQITNITYSSYLNQPDEIFLTSSRWIKYTYNGNDELLKAEYNTGEYWEYADIFVFKNGSTYQMAVPDGRAIYSGGSWIYEFDYTDHLGNTRVSFRANGSTLQKTAATDFDPWGVRLNGTGVVNSFQNRWELQGKEKESTFNLNRINFGARVYNPTIGRWDRVDPLADKYYAYSTFNYTLNNPINMIDPDGRLADYFDREGNHLGTDGVQDGKIYILNAGVRAKTENTNVNWGGTLSDNHVSQIKNNSTEIGLNTNLGQMIRTVYAEASGQGVESKLAVAEVIRNRATDNTMPSSDNNYTAQFSKNENYTDVVKQKGQFESVQRGVPRYRDPLSVTKGNPLEQKAYVESASAAIKAHYQNTATASGALFFYSPYIKAPGWTSVLKEVSIKGVSSKDFKFYKYK